MKKLMFAAAAVAACVAVADVTSANIVGYMDSKTSGENCYVAQTAVFRPISGAATLKDLVAKAAEGEFQPGDFEIQLVGLDASTAVVSEETMGAFCPDALDEFEGEDLAFNYVAEMGGWFLTADFASFSYDMNDYPIPEGTGFLMYTHFGFDGAKITSAGQVGKTYVDVSCPENSYRLSGNIAPKEMTMGDFTAVNLIDGNEFQPGDFEIQLLGDDGSTAVVSEETMSAFCPDALDEFEGEDLAFNYVEEMGGWFLTADFASFSYDMNDYPISAGRGFFLYTHFGFADGVKVALPPAIEEDK